MTDININEDGSVKTEPFDIVNVIVSRLVGKPTHRHVATGKDYTLLGYAVHAEIGEQLAVYCSRDCKLLARPKAMFHDGRFIALGAPDEK